MAVLACVLEKLIQANANSGVRARALYPKMTYHVHTCCTAVFWLCVVCSWVLVCMFFFPFQDNSERPIAAHSRQTANAVRHPPPPLPPHYSLLNRARYFFFRKGLHTVYFSCVVC